MSKQQPGPGKQLLKNIFKLLLACLLIGVICGYLFIELPAGTPADEQLHFSAALGFAYGSIASFIGAGILIARYFIQNRKTR
ncbi:hypothetical protein [Amphritea sp. HPY]|uniref:hypothetical protein n=1 Tax=Amphritea sp. HPY TaxID=3421652 RepID=UPI003D7D8ADE